jgi:hypothetical protein
MEKPHPQPFYTSCLTSPICSLRLPTGAGNEDTSGA